MSPKMFELLGDSPAEAAAEAATVLRIETALAGSQMTRVERRDPPKLYHKMSVEDLEKLAPAFGWKTYFTKTGVPSLVDAQRSDSSLFPRHERRDREGKSGGLEDVPALACSA